ncbi:MAG: capsule assembly Wzi family protein [Prevotellaceae bacterium]|nr:capsule assembly Wzi family protein [Prevotellaceae bacterium]
MSTAAEFGTSVHTGNHTPLWLASNRHGLSSLRNSGYLRGAVFYKDTLRTWQWRAALDVAATAGFTAAFVVQQAYIDLQYRRIRLSAGSREHDSPLLNQTLSSGGLTWSGNARPIPQVRIETADYVQLSRRLALKAELAYGWMTDNRYQRRQAGAGFSYTKHVKYHHKALFARIGIPQGRWQMDIGMTMDVQFGGYKLNDDGNGFTDLGNGIGDYLRVLVPSAGNKSKDIGEQMFYQGNALGSEHLRLTYRLPRHQFGIYLENFYDDFSGMGKLNGFDGLWGIEYQSRQPQLLSGVVLEYYQTTNQSGPLHGLDYTSVHNTGGADDYYNNFLYPGWAHWGMTMANPLIASPIYNSNGDMTFLYNRVKAFHLGFTGNITREWKYVAKISFNKTYGTPFRPTSRILQNLSTFASIYYNPARWKGWMFSLAVATDSGRIYGNNAGSLLNIHKTF